MFRKLWQRVPTGIVQIAVIIGLVVSALIYAEAPSKEEAASRSSIRTAARDPETDRPLVSIVVPQIASNTVRITSTGSIVVRNSVDLVPQVSGRITWVADDFRRGGRVRADQPVLEIDRSDFELAAAQAAANTQAARSSLELAEATSDAAISNYALLNPGADVPPLVAKLPQIEQTRAQLAAAIAAEQIAQLDLSRTRFSLPFDGRVVASRAEVGQLLNKGQSFGEVFALESIEAEVPVSAMQLDMIRPAVGRVAEIVVGSRRFAARVVRVSPNLDERTRFAQLYLEVDGAEELVPGSFIDVEVEGPNLANTLLLPEAAEQTGATVWSVTNGRLTRVTTQFLNRNREGIVASAFDVGDGVVLGTVPGGYEGMLVDVEVSN